MYFSTLKFAKVELLQILDPPLQQLTKKYNENYLPATLWAIELRSCTLRDPLEVKGMEKIPKARRISPRRENPINTAKSSVEFDDFRDKPLKCFPLTAIVDEN